MELKTAGLRKHSGKARLPLKTRLHKAAGITDGCRDSYPLWTHRMLTGLRSEAGKGSNNVIHRMIQPNSLPNFPVKGKSLAVIGGPFGLSSNPGRDLPGAARTPQCHDVITAVGAEPFAPLRGDLSVTQTHQQDFKIPCSPWLLPQNRGGLIQTHV